MTDRNTPSAPQTEAPPPKWQVYFSGATSAIVRTLDEAKKSILVQAYSFTSAPIGSALVRAHKRGVDVQVILDRCQRSEKYSCADFLSDAGIKTLIDAAHAIARNKVIIVDNKMLITGSFNFTRAAEEKNAENLSIIRSEKLAIWFLENWHIHQKHSVPFSQRSTPE